MSAVWRAARAAVRRRRLQTTVIGIVVGLSSMLIVVGLALVGATFGPFDQAYTQQQGAHLVASFDGGKATGAALADSAHRSGVSAAAGPFGQATVEMTIAPDQPRMVMTVVGRDRPDTAVDKVHVWQGRWVAGPGEIVIDAEPTADPPSRLDTVTLGDGRTVKVVGFAYTVSHSAQAWVSSEEMRALRPTTQQMLYRFTAAATAAEISAGQAAVTAGMPAGALLGTQSYLTLRANAELSAGIFVPFLMIFGCFGLVVAVLIVANVISGAVVAGLRHIGVLKALGFTPNQVMAVYLTMVLLPTVAAAVLGTILGNVLAMTVLSSAFFESYGAGAFHVAPWVTITALLGVPVLVGLTALLSSVRARRLSAVEAISAGSAPRRGRGLLVQRWLGGTRLPRAVSLGVGLPLARPARSALTSAAVLLGVAGVTVAIGLSGSVTAYVDADTRADAVQVEVRPARGGPTLGDQADESMLRALPGAERVVARKELTMRWIGGPGPAEVRFYRGSDAGYEMLKGRWPTAAGEVAVSSRFLTQSGLALGGTFTLEGDGGRLPVRVVGEVLMGAAEPVLANWATLTRMAPGSRADAYEVKLAAGADDSAYVAAVTAGDPGLRARPTRVPGSVIAAIYSTITVLTLLLGAVAALGVFNTVVLNVRERRRDLGTLKSIGMTPRQVVLMMVTSMAALGLAGGLAGIPIGVVFQRYAMNAIAHAAQIVIPDHMLDLYSAPIVVLLVLAGAVIAAAGAFLPSRSAARLTIADALRTE
ncbi:ABC transporter permease [Sphaerisporangium corydalis]|uniref:FtsX-like permease family protein n=1 Tax=Sphaerisporangium corydalis TaxID=1441875 RepID=A0ABV9ER18_9ACTN|nr:ABC transporter permease [Sphaerisporangium corydalis]